MTRTFGWGGYINLLVILASLVGGCATRTAGLFTRPELTSYDRMAVLGLTPEQEQLFMAAYTKGLPGPGPTFVERARLQDVISGQDLLKGRLNEKTRARIRQILGVEALIMCEYYDAIEGGVLKKFRVRIVDSSTGAIVGSVITQGRDDFDYHA
ncbi:MAG: hypothetical protein QHH07_00125 [Sedimentisphaerales bacterium]|jgi:hypothetical protein|nr:hypothetical protein [Sedimentisphaerales bacterium]